MALGPYALAWVPSNDTIHSIAEIGAQDAYSANVDVSQGK